MSAVFKARNSAKRKARVGEVLRALEDMGQVRVTDDGERFFAVA